MDKLFPSIIILLNLSAAGAYAYKCDYNMTIYWLAAAMLNAAATFRQG